MKWAYYNDNDAFCCEWLRNLIKAGHIPEGEVDGRPIQEVKADELQGFRQVHFFAGIGGWAYALRVAGWPPEEHVWTGSCPCQPYSQAGKGQGDDDPRNLWPIWRPLIAECRPSVVFGEQVAQAIRHGWLDGISVDLEAEGYTCGAVVLPACGLGAPHIRQRLWWVADACGERRQQEREGTPCDEGADGRRAQGGDIVASHGKAGGLAESSGCGQPRGAGASGQDRQKTGDDSGVEHAKGGGDIGRGKQARPLEKRILTGPWSNSDLIPCADGKARRVEPGTFPLAHGVPARVGRLRAYGNAIVPQVAAEFIQAYREAVE